MKLTDLGTFFTEPNKIHLLTGGKISPSDWSDDINCWLSGDSSTDHGTICLPVLYDDGRIEWIATARNEQAFRAIRDEIEAFIGPSYAKEIKCVTSGTGDSLVDAITQTNYDKVYRIIASNNDVVQAIRIALKKYAALLNRRPNIDQTVNRSFGLVRSDFEKALALGNEVSAFRIATEMKNGHRLTLENHRYIDIRLLAGLGKWQELAGNLQLLSSLRDLHLPIRVFVDVMDALYHSILEPYLEKLDALAAQKAFAANPVSKMGSLFGTRHGVKKHTVVTIFLLHESLKTDFDRQYVETLFEALHSRFDWLGEIIRPLFSSGTSEIPGEIPDLQLADEAFHDFEYDLAYTLYLKLPRSTNTMVKMIQCLEQIGDPKLVSQFVGIVEDLDIDLISQLRPLQLDRYHQLKESLSFDAGPIDWISWVEWVKEGAGLEKSTEVLEQESLKWEPYELIRSPKMIKQLSNEFYGLDGEALSVVQAGIPYLYESLSDEESKFDPALQQFFCDVLMVACLKESTNLNDLEFDLQLASAILDAGTSTDIYGEVIGYLSDIVESNESITNFDWQLDLAEMLALRPAPDKGEARTRLFARMLRYSSDVAHRLSPVQRIILDLLCRDYSVDLPAVVAKQDQEGHDLQAKGDQKQRSIGIYSLTITAAQRAKKTFEEMWPGIQVTLNDDHECTERLKNLARSSDIFVFAWRSSKHQAFFCIKNNRDKKLPFLQPLGKGSASIVRIVVESFDRERG